jgi:hypothetical protein
MPRCPKKRNAGNDSGTTRIKQDLRKQSKKAPTFLFWTTREHRPGDAIDAPDPAVSSQPTTILVTAALKGA